MEKRSDRASACVGDAGVEQVFGVFAVGNGEVASVAEAVGVQAQDTDTNGVKGAAPKIHDTAAEQVSDPFHHFAGRLVGEGQQEDAVGRDSVLDEPGDAIRQRARLACARTGKDQAGPRLCGDGLILLGVELLRVVDP